MASLTQYKQFVQNEPHSWIEYRTLEIWHEDFSQTYRFVDKRDNLTATLEAGAPRDPSTPVLFENSGLKITDPSEREDNDQLLNVKFANIGGEVQDMIEQVSGQGYLKEVQIIYRKYYSGNLNLPASPPLYLSASVITFDSSRNVSFNAEDTDMTTKKVGTFYITEVYPGLGFD